jgi:Ni/Fe-hydrogenase subunit HybB-like protein
LAAGWRGSARHWQIHQTAYFLIAALAVPLVVSLHSIVSLTLAATIQPGWHSTIFPPYFLAGAVLSGFAMILTIAILLRVFYNLEEFITTRHLDLMAKILIASSLVLAYGYLMDHFIAWYSGDEFQIFVQTDRLTGPYAPLYWVLLGLTVLLPQSFWLRGVRTNLLLLFVFSILINVGMWMQRFVIVVTGLYRDFLPSSWDIFTPTLWDWTIFVGTFGLFAAMLFLFIRYLPLLTLYEVKEQVVGEEPGPE